MRVLGLSGGYGHDASACLVNDTVVEAYVEEERLTRRRHAIGSPPHRAAAECLRIAGGHWEDVDVVAFSWNPFYPHNPGRSPMTDHSAVKGWLPHAALRARPVPVVVVDHQLAHAASAYRTSGYDNALVVSADGAGDGASLAVYAGRGGKLTMLARERVSSSLGWFYQMLTEYIGLGSWQQTGQTMALAAYGTGANVNLGQLRHAQTGRLNLATRHDDPRDFDTGYTANDSVSTFLRTRYHVFRLFGESSGMKHATRRESYDWLTGWSRPGADALAYADLAAAGQNLLEDSLMGLAEEFGGRDLSKICLAGGVAMNCKAVGRLLELPWVDGVYVPPVASDVGGALGAGLETLWRSRGVHSISLADSAAYGPSYPSEAVGKLLDRLGYEHEHLQDELEAKIAEEVAQGKIVGRFDGRMEVGARALGNRSILALPGSRPLAERINREVKDRATWRPFSPSVLDLPDSAELWETKECTFRFMSVAVKARPGAIRDYCGTVHIDGTSRIQHVAPDTSYGKVLAEVAARTGHIGVLNTSMNLGGDPIVCNPVDALKVFAGSAIDVMFLNDYRVVKGRP